MPHLRQVGPQPRSKVSVLITNRILRAQEAFMAGKKHDTSETGSHISPNEAAEQNGEARPQNAASQQTTGGTSPNTGFSSANPPRTPSGLATGLQPGGMVPGGGPGASVGSIGTGGAQTEKRDTGSLKRDGK